MSIYNVFLTIVYKDVKNICTAKEESSKNKLYNSLMADKSVITLGSVAKPLLLY